MKNWVDEIPDEQSDEERRDHCGRPPQFGFLKIHSPNQARPDQAKATQSLFQKGVSNVERV